MTDIDAVCHCGEDMSIESQGEFIRLCCRCGAHKLVNISKMKGPKDTQPVPVVTKGMSMEDIHAARERLVTEDTRDGFEKSPLERMSEEWGPLGTADMNLDEKAAAWQERQKR